MTKSDILSDNFSTLSYSVKGSRLPSWLYNPDTKCVLGKTKGGWFKLLLFYIFFYVTLIVFWAGMMSVFIYFILPTDQPMRSGSHSLLSLNPGLGIRPQINHENIFIRFSPNDPQTYFPYKQSMDTFLDQYYHLSSKVSNERLAKCENGKKTPDDVEKICPFDLVKLGDCKTENYGFPEKTPCVIIKMNKIYGWLPNLEDQKVGHALVTCDGANPLDKENIGELTYFPSIEAEVKNKTRAYGYFDSAYYPYIGQSSYVAPVVAVQFKSLKPNVIVHIQCQLSNIKNAGINSEIRFEIAMDDYLKQK